MLSVRGFGVGECPSMNDVVSVEDGVEMNDSGVDDGKPVGNSRTGIGRERAAALIEPGGELVGEKRSDGEV
jgi:hypothetical protein